MLIAGGLAALAISLHGQEASSLNLSPAKMPKLAMVDPRFASYNVEMVEVTGGRFWKPYKSGNSAPNPGSQQNPNPQVGENASLFEYRPPSI